MANKIKLKQSSVSGKVPTTTDLDLGELGINTYDGKLFLKQKVGAVETIIDVTGAASGVTSVSGSAPIVSSGGVTPSISISAATTLAAGSMSAADKTKIDAVTGTNTGDETASTIKTKLGITTLSGSNTGDQVIPIASSTAPAALGTAAVGTGTTFARADHVHTLPSLATLGAQAAGSYVTVGGALGTPSSGTLTNCTFPTLNQNTTGSSGSCTGNAATATTCNGSYLTTNAQQNGSDGWWRSTGQAGWYSSTYAVGIWATEAGNVRTYNGANFIAAGYIAGTNITSGGNVTGSSTSCTGNAATATSATSATNATNATNYVGGTGYTVGNTAAFASANDTTLSVRGTSTTAATMSFHRPGAYAANFGIDTDNILKYGGWSAGTVYPVYHGGNPQPSVTGSSGSCTGNAATATSLSGSAFSAAASGYYKVATSGMIIQWGTMSGTGTHGTSYSFTFPLTFPTACQSISSTVQQGVSTGVTVMYMPITALSTTGATVQYGTINGGSYTYSYRWIAIGY